MTHRTIMMFIGFFGVLGLSNGQTCAGNACNVVTIKSNGVGKGFTVQNSGGSEVVVRVRWLSIGGCLDPEEIKLAPKATAARGNGGICNPYDANLVIKPPTPPTPPTIEVHPSVSDTTKEAEALVIPHGGSAFLNVKAPSKPSCEQIKNVNQNGTFHNLGCDEVSGPFSDGSWQIKVEVGPTTGGLYYFRISASGASRVGTVYVPH